MRQRFACRRTSFGIASKLAPATKATTALVTPDGGADFGAGAAASVRPPANGATAVAPAPREASRRNSLRVMVEVGRAHHTLGSMRTVMQD